MLIHRKKAYILAVWVLPIITVAMACMVLVGWYVHSSALVQILPQFAPMQYNTALGLGLSGLGICAAGRGARKTALMLGVLVMALGLLTLAQYVLGHDYGIDELFMDAYILTKVSHPGRMAPNTALCFTLVGLALLVMQSQRAFLSCIGALSLLTFLAIVGYITNVEGLYGLASLTRMALHTAVGFALLAISLFILYSRNTQTRYSAWDMMPIVAAAVLIVTTAFAWYSAREFVQKTTQQHFGALVTEKIAQMQKRFSLYEHALLGGVGFINGSSNVTRGEWKNYTQALQLEKYLPSSKGLGFIEVVKNEQIEAYEATVAQESNSAFMVHPRTQYDDAFVIKYIEPIAANKSSLGLDIGYEINRRKAAERARDTGEIMLTEKVSLVQDEQSTTGFLLLAPVYEQARGYTSVEQRRAHLRGWVFSPFTVKKFMQDFRGYKRNQLTVTIYEGDEITPDYEIYSDARASLSSRFSDMKTVVTLPIAGQIWTVVWQPTIHFTPNNNTQLPLLIVIVGIIITILLTFVFYLMSRLYGISAKRHKEAEEALKNEKELLEMAEETALLGHWYYDVRTTEVTWSEQIYNIHGVRREDYVPNIETAIDFYHPDDRALVKRKIEKASKSGKNFVFEARLLRPDGTMVDVYSVGNHKRDEEGNVLGIFGIFQDISEQKKAERRQAGLVDKLAESNVELERFAHVASHDLQEPLRTIRNFSAMIKKDEENVFNEKSRKYFSMVIAAAERMQALIDDLLAYSRLTQSDDESEEVDLQKTMDMVMINLSERMSEKNATVNYSHLPTVYGNPIRLLRLLQNLVANGMKYQPEGQRPEISVSVSEKDDMWEFCVTDNGIGMKPEYCQKIFEPFKRLHSHKKYSGTGIGLAICQKILENLGGTIWAESAINKGSRFYFTLPKNKE